MFNDYFTSIIKHLHIEKNEFNPKHVKLSNNLVLSSLNKFQNHPSILKIKFNRSYAGYSGYLVDMSKTILQNLRMKI